MKFTLRPYQEAAVQASVDYLQQRNSGNGIVICPTGGGKSLILANIIYRLGAPTLVFQPSKEILEQNVAKMESYGYRPGIYSASAGQKRIGEITFATIGSVKSIPELFKQFKYVLIDECHQGLSAKGGMFKDFLDNLDGVRLLGFSVAADSYVELSGGPFGAGFVGEIERAFQLAVEKNLHVRFTGELEIIDLEKVFARGWIGDTFGWKPCNRLIRHRFGGWLHQLSVRQGKLSATPSHSIYVAQPGKPVTHRSPTGNRRRKNIASLACVDSSDIKVGDVLLGDNGEGWENTKERAIDMVDFAYRFMPTSRVRVHCEVSAIPYESLVNLASGKRKKAMARRWLAAGSIPIRAYFSLGNQKPPASFLQIEGSKVTIAARILLSEWAYLLGFYLGDGWLCREKSPIGCLGFAVELSLIKRFIEVIQSLPGVKWKPRIRSTKSRGSVEFRINNYFVYRVIEQACGRVACHQKFIPGEWIISWPREARLHLLQGLLDSDGHISSQGRDRLSNRVTTTSQRLAQTILALLRSLGVSGSLHVAKPRPGGIVEGGRQIMGIHKRLDVVWSGHAQAGDSNGHRGSRRHFAHDGLSFTELQVKSNVAIQENGYVYDLEMDGHPSFVASGALVHNTATPYRLATNSFGAELRFLTRTRPRIFKDVVFYVQNKTLFDAGYLARIEYVDVKGFNRSALRMNSTGAEFDDSSVKRHCQDSAFISRTIEAVRQASFLRKNVLVFTRFIEESQRIVANVPNAAIVTGETPKRDRERILSAFKSGQIRTVCNVGVLTTGFDFPELETIILSRPTMSLGLYYQMIGRGIRPHPQKTECQVIDLCGNYRHFGKVEDLRLVDGGNGKWYIASGDKQLTNVQNATAYSEMQKKQRFIPGRFRPAYMRR